jgi:hypothetical protein
MNPLILLWGTMMDEIIQILDRYGAAGVTGVLLIMNFFVIQKLFESLKEMNKILTKTINDNTKSDLDLSRSIEALAVEVRRRPCMRNKSEDK